MSTTYYAIAIVGCKVAKSKLRIGKDIRGCDHYLPSVVCGKFCPQCGVVLWIEKEKWIPQFDEDEETICGFKVFHNEYEDYVIIAEDYVATNCDGFVMDGSMLAVTDTSREKLRNVMEPIGLWDNGKTFGIWPFLDIC